MKKKAKTDLASTMDIKLTKPVGGFTMMQVIQHNWRRGDMTFMTKLRVSEDVYRTNDSILEIPEWYAFCVAPRSVALQIETHKKKNGCYVWMSSARPDRDKKAAEEYSREQPVHFVMKFTARGIIEISHYRMCQKAEEPTRIFMKLLKKTLLDYGHGCGDHDSIETARQMMPMCAFRNGLCTEMRSCGKPKKYMED